MHGSAVLCARSVWKGPFVVAFPGLQAAIKSGKMVKTRARACTIMPHMIGANFGVHNGKDYVPVRITEEMVGRKLGEFSHTRKKFVYRLTKNK
ncbi:mitochondrial ribosomal small subunit component [Coemansia sp. RSA 552]|nr:mitochondrial ribosomal small subunit component [Coemansia sp. RSA 552]